MLRITNEGRRPLRLDSTIKFELKTTRPPVPGAYERIEQGDVLLVNLPDVQVVINDDTLALRGV